MPSGSPSVEIGPAQRRPLKVFSRAFWAITEYSTISSRALMPASRHIPTIASPIGLSLARYPAVDSKTTTSPLYPPWTRRRRARSGSWTSGGRVSS